MFNIYLFWAIKLVVTLQSNYCFFISVVRNDMISNHAVFNFASVQLEHITRLRDTLINSAASFFSSSVNLR